VRQRDVDSDHCHRKLGGGLPRRAASRALTARRL